MRCGGSNERAQFKLYIYAKTKLLFELVCWNKNPNRGRGKKNERKERSSSIAKHKENDSFGINHRLNQYVSVKGFAEEKMRFLLVHPTLSFEIRFDKFHSIANSAAAAHITRR